MLLKKLGPSLWNVHEELHKAIRTGFYCGMARFAYNYNEIIV